MEYDFREIEQKWQQHWRDHQTYQVTEDPTRKKFYVLNMFPYPSGAGLHVGHPLGYIASDIYARYKRQQGFNVLNPMGYDAYGLPAEQYAIQTGQHPAVTTEQNIKRYREQLDKIGFCFDWSREVRTCDAGYYHWTQWAFERMFESYYDNRTKQARPIHELVRHFEEEGTLDMDVAQTEPLVFSARDWRSMNEKEQQQTLMNYRIAYLGETMVNWCQDLGTVLANDEVVDGVSVRGGYPVVQRKMRQWCLRVSAYAQRMLDGLDLVNWSDSIKETQRNWVGRSEGAEMHFESITPEGTEERRGHFTIFTTRADTIFGVTFMVLAPESELVAQLTTSEQREEVEAYLAYVVPLIEGADVSQESFDAKEGTVMNSPREGVNSTLTLNGLTVQEAIAKTKAFIAEQGIGQVKVNYRLRDAIFSRQRYWGEPFPVYYKDDMPYMIPEDCLPLQLPEIDAYKPTESGEPPLGRAEKWAWDTEKRCVVEKRLIDHKTVFPIELCTMPGFAGSSAYYLRYMDPHNDQALVGKKADEYWQNVDLYVGGTEHATGHLIYSRFWNKFLFDLGVSCKEEPFQRLVNQGMIQGRSNFVYRVNAADAAEHPVFVSKGLRDQYDTTPIHVDVNIVHADVLDLDAFRAWRPELKNAEFVLEDGKYVCGWAIEKMSKSMFNVVNPDDIVSQYGADTLRLYEMFLGPVEASKPWDTNGIDGCHRFLKKFWKLFQQDLLDEDPTKEELKSLHKLIKKVSTDIEVFSYNTSVSAFMVCTNELTQQKCRNLRILRTLVTVLAPFAPHIAEELWEQTGGKGSVCDTEWPTWNEDYLVEDEVQMPVSFNGKARFQINLPATASKEAIIEAAMNDERSQKYLEGKQVVKTIVVPGRIINIVVK